jgi:hypothetical protein
MGEADEEGNVISFDEDAQNGVDLVVYPGRPGSGLVEKLYENAKKDSSEPSVEVKKENEMELKDVKELIEAANAELVTALIEALKPSAPAEGEVDFAAVAETVVKESDLTPRARARVFESVKNGMKVEDAIASEKADAEEYKAKFAENKTEEIHGRVVQENADKGYSLSGALGFAKEGK